jgi:hypothetical protein
MDKFTIVVIISILTSLSVLTFSVEYQTLLPLATAIAIVALIISVVTVWVHRESVQIQVKFKHSEDLHNFINEWLEWHQNYYKNDIAPTVGPVTQYWWQRNQHVLDQFRNKPLYKDLASKHLKYFVKKLKESHWRGDGDLISMWNQYNSTVTQFDLKCKEFYKAVMESVKTNVKLFIRKNIEIGDNFAGKDIITGNFVALIYSENVGRSSKYNYHRDYDFEYIKCGITLNGEQKEFYQVMAKTDNGTYNSVIANVWTKENGMLLVESFESSLTLLLEDANIAKLNKEIEKSKSYIDITQVEITQMLKALNEFPIFRGDCDFVKI